MASLFSGAFSTVVGGQIERATKEDVNPDRLSSLHAAICNEVTSTTEGPRDAVKALKKRLFNNKNWRVVLPSLSLLELLCRECGREFTLLIAHRDFLNSLVNLTLPKSNSPTVVRDFVLLLIKKWASDYKNVHELVTMCAMYETLKQKGTDFPSRDLSDLIPLLSLSQDPDTSGEESHRPTPPSSRRHQQQQQPMSPAGPVSHSPSAGAGGVPAPEALAPNTEQETKLRGELEIVRLNTEVMKSLLDELTPGSENLDDFTLLQDLNKTCRAMRSRIVELIDCMSHDGLICDLLMANDNLNNAFTSFDGFMARRAALAGASSSSGNELSVTAAADQPAGGASAVPSEMSLIDMDSLPAMTTTAAPVVATGAMSLAQPTTQVEDDDDGFDSFAQSRGHSMAPAPAAQPAGDASRNPFADDVRQSPAHEPVQPSIQPVTSSEFDDFLALRSNPTSQPAASGATTANVNLFDPTPVTAAQPAAPTSSSQDAALQDLLNFAAPAPEAAMQSQQAPPGNRPAMQTDDPTDGMFGF